MSTEDLSHSGDWHEVWECPRCGTQFAIGHGTARLGEPMKCSSFGHESVECEQKLVQAFPITEREAGLDSAKVLDVLRVELCLVLHVAGNGDLVICNLPNGHDGPHSWEA